MTPLADALTAAVPLLPESLRDGCARLFVPEHLSRIAAHLADWHTHGVPAEPPPPRFDAECTPPVGPAFEPFREPLCAFSRGDADAVARFAAAMAAVGCDGLLLLLGQRRTPASLTDARGIPPADAELLASAATPHTPGVELTVAARALAKHAHRSPDRFWGAPAGPSAEQNAHAAGVLAAVLAGRTWWNVFGHYQHETVFEARLPTGHGARWAHDGREFIGFLEPFRTVGVR